MNSLGKILTVLTVVIGFVCWDFFTFNASTTTDICPPTTTLEKLYLKIEKEIPNQKDVKELLANFINVEAVEANESLSEKLFLILKFQPPTGPETILITFEGKRYLAFHSDGTIETYGNIMNDAEMIKAFNTINRLVNWEDLEIK